MTDRENPQPSLASGIPVRPNDSEVMLLIEEAARQYDEYIRLAGLADISALETPPIPDYDWSLPLGLVIDED